MFEEQTHFTCFLDMPGGESVSSTWDSVNKSVRRWLHGKLPVSAVGTIDIESSVFNIGTSEPLTFAHHLVEVARETGHGTGRVPQFWALRYEHADKTWQNRRWRTDIGVEVGGSNLSISVKLSHYLEGDWFGKEPYTPTYSIPGVAIDFVSIGAYRDGRRLSLKSEPVKDLNSFVEFAVSAKRSLPIVLLSKTARNQFLIDNVEIFSRSLGAIAHVFHLESHDDAYFLSDLLGDDFSTYGGAIRVYQRNLDLIHDHPSRHRFFPPAWFREKGSKEIEDSLIRGLLRSSAAESDSFVGTIERVRAKEQEQLALLALGEDSILSAMRIEIAELKKEILAERSAREGAIARMQEAEERLNQAEKETNKERYKASLLISRIVAGPEDSEEVNPRVSKLQEKLGKGKVICIANTSAAPKFGRILAEELAIPEDDVVRYFEIHSMEQTSTQISNMVTQFGDCIVVYAWFGLKDATDRKKEFKKGIYQAKEVRPAIGWFRQWLDT